MSDSRQSIGRATETYYGCKLAGRLFSAAWQNEWTAYDRDGEVIGVARNAGGAKKLVREHYNIAKRTYTRKQAPVNTFKYRRNIRRKVEAIESKSGDIGALRAWFFGKCHESGRKAAYTELCAIYHAICNP